MAIQDLRSFDPGPPTGRILVLTQDVLDPTLVLALESTGMDWDLARDVREARQLFFAWGGHEALLIAPGMERETAREVIHSLRWVDETLPVLTFVEVRSPGGFQPPLTSLSDLDPGTEVGRKVFYTRTRASLRQARV